MSVWVRLDTGLWWPGCISDTPSTFVHMSHLRIVNLNELESIPVDISDEGSVVTIQSTENIDAKEKFLQLHCDQNVPDHLVLSFSLAMESLAKKLQVCIPASTQKKDSIEEAVVPSQLMKTTKRTSAISWDNYFMAVAFLSA